MSTNNRNDNTLASCGTTGSAMGYGGEYSSSISIGRPKLAVEYDFFTNSDLNNTDNNHLAIGYWSSQTDGDYDTRHNSDIQNPNPDSPSRTPDGKYAWPSNPADDGLTEGADVNWMEDGQTWSARVEATASGDHYTLKAWVKQCDNETCSDAYRDLESAYTDDAALVESILDLDTSDADQNFDLFYFGWTTGMGSVKQDLSISDFGLHFID